MSKSKAIIPYLANILFNLFFKLGILGKWIYFLRTDTMREDDFKVWLFFSWNFYYWLLYSFAMQYVDPKTSCM